MIVSCHVRVVCSLMLVLAVGNALYKEGFTIHGDLLFEKWHEATPQSCTTHCLKHKETCNQLLIENGTCLIMGSKFR